MTPGTTQDAELVRLVESDAAASLPTRSPSSIAAGTTGGSPRSMVLVTGATGFVGVGVTIALLERTSFHVGCLVRSSSAASGRERLLSRLAGTGRWQPDWSSRITAIDGDIERPYLGLDRARWDALALDLEHMFHAGAVVNGFVPYRALRAANVRSVFTMLELAASGGGVKVHYVSSAGVLRARRARAGGPSGGLVGLNDYLTSKAVAEHVLQRASSEGWSTNIFRLDVVTGDSVTGFVNALDRRWLIVRAAIALQSAPLLDGGFAGVPLDVVSRAIVEIATRDARPATYNLFGRHPVAWLDVFSWIRRNGHRLKAVDLARWHHHLERGIPADSGLARIFSIAGTIGGTGTSTEIEASPGDRGVPDDLGFEWQDFARSSLERSIDYGAANGHFSKQ